MESDNSVVIAALSVEEAIIIGLTRLAATREEVTIEVLDEGNKGFLGLGSREARVRVTRKPPEAETVSSSVPSVDLPTEVEPEIALIPAEQEPQPEPMVVVSATQAEPIAEVVSPSAAEVAAPAARAEKAPEALGQRDRAPRKRSDSGRSQHARRDEELPRGAQKGKQDFDREELEAIAHEITTALLPGLEIETALEWIEEDRPTLWINLGGRDADALVGPRARNLHAAQYLIRALIYRRLDGNYNIVVDADGYRKRRRRSLETLAQSKADRAVEMGRTIRLRPMPAHERRIVHITLRKDSRVTTESVGKGRERAVTIVPKGPSEPGV